MQGARPSEDVGVELWAGYAGEEALCGGEVDGVEAED